MVKKKCYEFYILHNYQKKGTKLCLHQSKELEMVLLKQQLQFVVS